MQIIYDKEKVVQEKLRLDTEIPEQNRKYKKANIIRTIVFIICELMVACLVGWSSTTLYHLLSVAGIVLCIVAGLIGAGVVYTIYIDSTDKIMPAEDYYSPAVKYYCASKDKKLLKAETSGNPPWQLTLVLEDQDHIVTEETINLHFAEKTRADINETIIDLNKHIVYTPYKKQDAGDDASLKHRTDIPVTIVQSDTKTNSVPSPTETKEYTKMPLSEFLLKHTNARELCVITMGGWINATFFIDHEDLFIRYLHPDLNKAAVKSDHWDTLPIVNGNNSRVEVPAHFIEVS